MTNEQFQTAIEQHFYWFTKAADALTEMTALAINPATESEKFAAAQARFKEARGRCLVEFEIVQKGFSEGLKN